MMKGGKLFIGQQEGQYRKKTIQIILGNNSKVGVVNFTT